MNPDRMKRLLGGKIDITKVSVGHGDQGDEDPGVESAKDIIAAIKSDDPEQLDQALKDHYKSCEGMMGSDDGKDTDEDGE